MFDRELALFRKRSRSAGSFGLIRPASADEEDLRRAAFAMTRLRLTNEVQQMLAWRAIGMTQAEMARRLGITRQAVSKSFKAVDRRLQSVENIRWGARNYPLQRA
jgi:DNA-binding CsgD family transcriptional regulator